MWSTSRQRHVWAGAVAVGVVLAAGAAVWAHFQVIRPSSDIVSASGNRTVDLDILFTHPMEDGPAMAMGRPRRFGVLVGGKKQDLTATLQVRKVQGKTAYAASCKLKQPACASKGVPS